MLSEVIMIWPTWVIYKIKKLWSDPRDMFEAEWYILLAVFIMIWMWMII
jgi:hypothetical protein